MITAKSVKELRDRTGAGMMACKKALTETDGDVEKAIDLLREKGLAAAAKKAGRVAAEGIVKTYQSEDMKKAVVVEVNCETDFVAENDQFKGFVDKLAVLIANSDVNTVEELEAENFENGKTVKEALTDLIAALGENMTIRRFKKFNATEGVVQTYMHGGGRIGVAVYVKNEKDADEAKEVAKELCMQVAAANPLF